MAGSVEAVQRVLAAQAEGFAGEFLVDLKQYVSLESFSLAAFDTAKSIDKWEITMFVVKIQTK